jgi:hypothetical protein
MRGKFFRSTLVSVAVLVGSAGAVMAADVCFTNSLVLKGFKVPGKGKCKPYQGFFAGPQIVDGVACTSSDNQTVYLSQTWISLIGPGVGTDKATLDRATLSGTGAECTPTTCSPVTFTKTDCPQSPVPIP